MPPSGLANRYAIARAGRSRDRQSQPACERRPALSGGDGTFPGSIRSIGQAVDAHALWISPIHDLPTQNARPPASAHASALFHSICLALVLALIVLFRGGVAWAQQAPPPEGKTYAQRLETRAPEPSHARVHAPQEQAGLSLRERFEHRRSQSLSRGLVLAQFPLLPRPCGFREPGAAGSAPHFADRKGDRNPLCAGSVSRRCSLFETDCGIGDPAQIKPAVGKRAFRRDRRGKIVCASICAKEIVFGRRKT